VMLTGLGWVLVGVFQKGLGFEAPGSGRRVLDCGGREETEEEEEGTGWVGDEDEDGSCLMEEAVD
jgi:hypothetical protein